MVMRPALAAPVVAGMVLFAIPLAFPAILADADTLWQIQAGHWILGNRAIPHTDPFSYTFAGQRWFAHEWLAQTLLALADGAGGLRGVMALTAAAAGLTAGLLMFHLRRFMALVPAVLVLVQALANCAGSLLARPHVLAWPCLVLWCAGLLMARARQTAPSWWLLPVIVLWVNLHGSFAFGLMLAVPLMVEAMIAAGAAWRQPLIRWSLFIAAAWAAALLNPDTIEGVLFPFRMLRMQRLNWIGEWSPSDFTQLHPLEFSVLLLLGLALLGRLTVPPVRAILLLGLVHMAFQHARHDQLFGLVGALLLAGPIGRIAPAEPVCDTVRPSRRFVPPALAAACGALALFARFQVPLAHPPGAAVLAALDQVPADVRARPVLNDYGYGAFLIVHGDRPFIDSRADMYGDAFLARFQDIAAMKPGALTATLAEWRIAWTVFPPDSPVVPLLDREPGWRRLLSATGAVVHVRDEPGAQTWKAGAGPEG